MVLDTNRLRALLDSQQRIVEQIALQAPLADCLRGIALDIETIMADPDIMASILLLDGERVRNGAAPSLPEAYVAAIDGQIIGPTSGSCGTAMYRREIVTVSDIATDPLWAAYRDAALHFGLRACWSRPILDSQGEVLGSFAIYSRQPGLPTAEHLDIIERFTHLSGLAIERDRQAERTRRLLAELEQSRHRLRALTDTMPDMAIVLDVDGRYVDFFGHDNDLLFRPAASVVGLTVREILPAETAEMVMSTIGETLRTGATQVVEYELAVPRGLCTFEGRTARVDGYDIDAPDKPHVIWAVRDISERKHYEKQIEQLAFHDPLTGLPNRQLLMDRLHQMLQHLARDGGGSALLFIDLDDFKQINDTLGHQHGDDLLRQVAHRLHSSLRGVDTVARLGGDEFVVLLARSTADATPLADEAIAVTRKLLAHIEQPYQLAGHPYRIRGSVGIVVFDRNDHDASEVLSRADAAMYVAKESQGERWAFFDPALQAHIDQRTRIGHDLQQAVERGEFETHFQPKIATDGHLAGAEALIRWRHPEHGVLTPDRFHALAEQNGLMHALQASVMRAACDLLLSLNRNGGIPQGFSVSINLSPVQFRDNRLEQNLIDALAAADASPDHISLELTERALLVDLPGTRALLQRLHELGFRLSLDDFGAGCTSLAYLNSLPLNEIKIDRHIVADIQTGDEPAPIIDAVLALAQPMGCHVVAEGVETEVQARSLTTRGVDTLQGYYFAHPMPLEALLAWLAAHTPRH